VVEWTGDNNNIRDNNINEEITEVAEWTRNGRATTTTSDNNNIEVIAEVVEWSVIDIIRIQNNIEGIDGGEGMGPENGTAQ